MPKSNLNPRIKFLVMFLPQMDSYGSNKLNYEFFYLQKFLSENRSVISHRKLLMYYSEEHKRA